MLSGAYEIDSAAWACPHCQREAIWSCPCDAFHGVLHCWNRRDGLNFCACGNREERTFEEVDRFQVRGRSGGSVAGNGRAPQQGLVPSSRNGR
jgi:hypothetical protein